MTAGASSPQALCPASAEMRVGALVSRNLARSALAVAVAESNLLNEAEALLQLGRIFTPSVEPHATLDAVTRAQQIFVVHAAPATAARCRIAAARALLDLGQEHDAFECARQALDEVALPVAHRVAGIVVMARSQAQFGKLAAASQLLLHAAAPLAEASSRACGVHVKKALVMVRLQLLLATQLPHLHSGLNIAVDEGAEPPGCVSMLELLDDIDRELPPGQKWAHVEVARQLTLGLCDCGERAIEGLAALAADNVEVDPPAAAWAWYAKALVHRARNDLAAAQASVGRCLALSEQWGLHSIARHAFLQRSLIRKSIADFAGSLQAYKIFSAMRLRGAMADAPSMSLVSASASVPEDARSPAVASQRPLESRHVKRAIRFIEAKLGVPISVSDIAAECGVSRRTLEVAFKQGKGCTLANYVKRRKLEAAAGLLRFSGLRVAEVASSVGYRWPSAFARDFVSRYGVRPTDWRAQHADEAPAQRASVG